MSEAILGTTPDASNRRDAVHIAVIPVIAAEILSTGDHVGLDENGRASVMERTRIGVVDPFLPTGRYIAPGGRFWLMLYPGTATNLRHDWDHPAFATSQRSADFPTTAAEAGDDDDDYEYGCRNC